MTNVTDSNVIPFALIADSMTRRLPDELDDLLTLASVHDEFGTDTELVTARSGLADGR